MKARSNSSTPIDSKLLKRLIQEASHRLKGDWVLMGGTVLPAVGIDYRMTTDVDLVGLKNPDQTQTLALMEIAEQLGLPVESINQAGAFFLSKIPDYSEHLVLLAQGRSARIYRPDLFLFVSLKVARLTESDTEDCLKFIDWVSREEDLSVLGLTTKHIGRELKRLGDEPGRQPRAERLTRILEALKAR